MIEHLGLIRVLATFLSLDENRVSRASGVALATLQDWKQRVLLKPNSDGYFTIHHIATSAAMAAIIEAGLAERRASKLAKQISPHVMCFMIRARPALIEAYVEQRPGDYRRAMHWERGDPAFVSGLSDSAPKRHAILHRGRNLYLEDRRAGHSFANDKDTVFIDLRALGRVLAKRASAPLIYELQLPEVVEKEKRRLARANKNLAELFQAAWSPRPKDPAEGKLLTKTERTPERELTVRRASMDRPMA